MFASFIIHCLYGICDSVVWMLFICHLPSWTPPTPMGVATHRLKTSALKYYWQFLSQQDRKPQPLHQQINNCCDFEGRELVHTWPGNILREIVLAVNDRYIRTARTLKQLSCGRALPYISRIYTMYTETKWIYLKQARNAMKIENAHSPCVRQRWTSYIVVTYQHYGKADPDVFKKIFCELCHWNCM